MLDQIRIDDIKEILENLCTEDLIIVHNEHCSYDDEIFDMDIFNEVCSGMTPMDIAQRIFFGDFNPNHNYFKYDGYANFESTDFPSDWIYTSDIAKHMYSNREDYDLSEVAELFEKWDRMDEDEE